MQFNKNDYIKNQVLSIIYFQILTQKSPVSFETGLE